MSKDQNNVPDAWEADWESLADKQDLNSEAASSEKKVSSKVTKAQRRAAQAEFNRQLWAEADAPHTFHYLESRSAVPLKQEYRPAVTVLSRRPQIVSRNGDKAKGADAAAAGISGLSLGADGKELSDSEDEANKPPEMTPEERQAKALKDREEKQRKYEEVRERLFGSSSTPGSGASSPGGTPPPSRNQSSGGDGNRGRGRNRGGGRDRDNNGRDKRDSPGNTMGKQRQLYDPNYSTKSNSTYIQRRDRQQQPSSDKSDNEQQGPKQPIRSPRGPDGNGRGGFGFSPRGRGA